MAKVLKNLLSDYGYNLVALPKEDIAPLLLLYKNEDGVSSVESKLQQLFIIEDVAPPVITKNKTVTSINGSATVIFDGESGFSMLDWLLQKLHMGKLSGKLNLANNNKVTISYENIKEDKVSLLDLDNFISGSVPDATRFHSFKQKLENSELYVINAVLKSNSFSIAVEDQNGQQVDMNATVKGIVDASVNISHSKKNAITLQHNDATPVVFAFKAQRIIYDEKKWWQFFKKDEANFHIKDQQGVILKNEDDFPTAPLKTNADLIDL
jgi:hypothetical protein